MFVHAGPIRLTTIAHAFNYRMAVLRDGVNSAARVGRSRRAEGCILEDPAIPWGHQVAVMFQIVSVLALEVPTFLQNIAKLQNVSLMYNYPVNHGDIRIIMVGVANVVHRIVQVLMFTVCLSYPGKVCLGQNGRMSQSLPGEVRTGGATYCIQTRGARDTSQYNLYGQHA